MYGAASILEAQGVISDKQEVSSLDFRHILSSIATEKNYEVRYYGVAKIKKRTGYGREIEAKTVKFADNLRKIRNSLKKNDIKYCATGSLQVRDRDECKKCGAKDYKMQEKGVDVGLAVDIVKDALKKQTKHIILISSDTDLIPAIKVANENKVKVTYVAFCGYITKSISRLADETKTIKNTDVAEAYANGLRKF